MWNFHRPWMTCYRSITSHSHIKSLGLDEFGIPTDIPGSVVGQEDAREAAGLVVNMIKTKKMSGKAVLISGPSGCGKTALVVGISRELGPGTPFTTISSSEVYSHEVKKVEILQEAIRRSILVKMKELKDIYEGEVVELKVADEENPFRSHSRMVKNIFMTLKTNKESKNLKLSPALYEQLDKQKIANGDVVYIEISSGVVKKLGKSEIHVNDFDLEANTYVPVPKGEVFKRREVVQSVTLHDLDIANAKPSGQDALSLVFHILRPKKTEITEKLRKDVNRIVNEYFEKGNAEIIPGVLFIEDAHMLDIECLTFLHKATESPQSPTLILASNRGLSQIRGGNGEYGPFGITKDLLNRVLVICMKRNTVGWNRCIIKMKLKEEEIDIEEKAFEHFVDLSTSKSLRYCIGLIPLLKGCCSPLKAGDIEEVCEIFRSS